MRTFARSMSMIVAVGTPVTRSGRYNVVLVAAAAPAGSSKRPSNGLNVNAIALAAEGSLERRCWSANAVGHGRKADRMMAAPPAPIRPRAMLVLRRKNCRLSTAAVPAIARVYQVAATSHDRP